jgi:Domain of unknown function (DUF4193)
MTNELPEDDEPQLAEVELDDADLDDADLDEDVIDDDLETIDLDDVEVAVDAPLIAAIVEADPDAAVVAAPATKGDEEDDDGLELDEELHPDDVEAPLDALLKERTASAKLEDEEADLEEEEADTDEPGEGPTKIMPRRPGEFLCTSCFLVLPRNQLADEARMLCRDCV